MCICFGEYMADQESIDELIGRLKTNAELRNEVVRLRDEIKNLYASNNRIGGKLRKRREENERLRAVVQDEIMWLRTPGYTTPTLRYRANLLERALKGES